MNNNSHSEQLKLSHEHRQALITAVENIASLIEAKKQSVFSLDLSRIDIIKKEKEDAMAKLSLGDINQQEFNSVQDALLVEEKHLLEVRQKNSQIQAEINGLQRRLEEAKLNENEAKQALIDAEANWIKEELISAEATYTQHAENLKQSYLRVMACISALASRNKNGGGIAIYSGEITIPILGATSQKGANPRASYSKNYFNEKRPVFDFGDINIDWDIAEIIQAKTTGKNSRLGKIAASIGIKSN
jgi:hypothetical protein